jgi:hypothetical protein
VSIDWQIVDRWATQIARNELADIRQAFDSYGARGPGVIWRPAASDLVPSQLHFLHDYWTTLAAGRPMPFTSDIDPLAMKPALGYIMLLDVIDGGRDFRYRLYGSRIAAVSGFDVTGRLVSEHPASSYMVQLTMAIYRAVVLRGEPVCTEHGPPATLHTAAWHRLVLPLADQSGAIARLLVGIVPIGHDGRPI